MTEILDKIKSNMAKMQNLPINEFSRDKINKSIAELKEEKSLVSDLLVT